MQERLEARLAELRAEFKAGEQRLAELNAEQVRLQQTLLRISGAIQVIEETLAGDDGHAASDVGASDVA